MPPGPGQRNIREVPPERDTGSPPDHRNRPANPSAPPALRNHGTVEEMERLIRTTRATHRGSSECSPSSTGTSHATQHSHHFYHSHRSHATRNVSRDGSRHGSWHCSRHSHRGRHGSRHRSRSRGISIPCCVPKFKRGQIPINLWSQQMVYYFSISGVGERNHVMCRINHFETKHFPEGQPYKIFSCPEFWRKSFPSSGPQISSTFISRNWWVRNKNQTSRSSNIWAAYRITGRRLSPRSQMRTAKNWQSRCSARAYATRNSQGWQPFRRTAVGRRLYLLLLRGRPSVTLNIIPTATNRDGIAKLQTL